MKTEQVIKIERLEEEVEFLKSVITNYQDVVSKFNEPQPIQTKPKEQYTILRDKAFINYWVENNGITEWRGSKQSCENYIRVMQSI